jgi:hypothetical protein
MKNLLLWAGRLAGVTGLVICVLSVVLRASGLYVFLGFELGSLFQAGTSGMVAGCFCLLVFMTSHSRVEH